MPFKSLLPHQNLNLKLTQTWNGNNIVGRVCIQVIAGLFVRSYLMIAGEQISETAGNAENAYPPASLTNTHAFVSDAGYDRKIRLGRTFCCS
jgi:hypothetical protein